MALSIDAGAADAQAVVRHERRYWWVAGATLLLGVVLRLWGYLEYEFWYDEAFWASRVLRSVAASARPVGYMYLSQALAKLQNTESVIRLPSLVAGIASLPLFLYVCRKARLSWPVSSLGLFVLAISPWAITASKEFKPYALELALHLVLLAITASYLSSRRTRALILLGGVGALSVTLSWTVAMLLPWLFFMLLALTLRDRNRRQALIVFGGGMLTAATMAAIFYVRLLGTAGERSAERFGNKYDVFFTGEGWLAKARWLLEKTAEVATFPAQLKLAWAPSPGLQAAIGWLHVAAVLAGVVYLVRGRHVFGLVAWVGTWATAFVLSAAGVFPYGVFRTNLFLLVYALLLVLCGLQLLADLVSTRPAARKSALALALAYVAFVFPYRLSSAAEKSYGGYTASVRRALETIKRHEDAAPPRTGKKALVLFDGLSCGPFAYYTKDHAVAREELGPFFKKKVEAVCSGRGTSSVKRRIKRAKKRDFWLIVSKPTYVEPLEAFVKTRCTPDVLEHLPGPSLLAHCPARE
jgi:hypothetical protein